MFPTHDKLVRIDRETHSASRVLLSEHYAVGSRAINVIEKDINDEAAPAFRICDAATNRTPLNATR